MNMIPYVRFVGALGIAAFLYFIFNILIKDYIMGNATISDVANSGPYDFFLILWNGLLLIVMIVEAIRLFVTVQRRTGF